MLTSRDQPPPNERVTLESLETPRLTLQPCSPQQLLALIDHPQRFAQLVEASTGITHPMTSARRGSHCSVTLRSLTPGAMDSS